MHQHLHSLAVPRSARPPAQCLPVHRLYVLRKDLQPSTPVAVASLAAGEEEEEEKEEELQIIVVGRGGLSSIRCGVGAVVPPQLRLMWLIVATAVVLKPLQLGSAGFLARWPQPFSLHPLPPFFCPFGGCFL